MSKLTEHLWSGIIHRSETGEIRKEDDLTQTDSIGLNDAIYNLAHAIVYDNGYENTKESFYYCLNNQWTKWDDYDMVLDFVEKNWDKISQEVEDCVKKEKNTKWDLEECEGVPGGLAPTDVSGMGDITFPDETGEKGSGDIPLPSKTVYTQVMPYGLFVKKKKKKKFRKEDEPCVHSDNSKIYDYVDDYRDYVDRTYDKIDGK